MSSAGSPKQTVTTACQALAAWSHVLDLSPVSTNSGERPRLLVFNQYYWPAVEATAHLLTELCEGLADEYDITVVAGAHPDAAHGRSRRGGVEIVRVASTSYDRRSLSLRALNYLTYVALSTAARMGA